MNIPQASPRVTQPTFVELFTPKLVTALREGYGFRDFQADAVAGLTVAIVALPLSMAIAIGSGVAPERGLYTAIVGASWCRCWGVIVAWNMAGKAEFWALLRASRGDALVLLATFGLTVFVDLTTGIAVGVVLGAFLFLHRMAEVVEVEDGPLVSEDQADTEKRRAIDVAAAQDRDVMVFRISGAFFFGATAAVSTMLDRTGAKPKAFIFDFRSVPLIDSTAATLRGLVKRLNRSGTRVYFAGTRHRVRETLFTAALTPPLVNYKAELESALASAKKLRVGETE
jgi:MFS superfamily sulfate permease-like transporter